MYIEQDQRINSSSPTKAGCTGRLRCGGRGAQACFKMAPLDQGRLALGGPAKLVLEQTGYEIAGRVRQSPREIDFVMPRLNCGQMA